MEDLQFSKICVRLEESLALTPSTGGQRRKTNSALGSQIGLIAQTRGRHSAHLLPRRPVRIPERRSNSRRGRRGIRRASSSLAEPQPTAVKGSSVLVAGERLQLQLALRRSADLGGSPLPYNCKISRNCWLWKFSSKCGNNRVPPVVRWPHIRAALPERKGCCASLGDYITFGGGPTFISG